MNKKPWAICGLLPVLLWIAGGLLVPAFAQVTYQSSSAAIGADGTSRTITIPLPAGTTAGNLLIASMSVRWYQATVTAPGGWTLLRDSQQSQGAVTCGSGSTAGIRTLTYYKTAVAGETAPTFGYSSTCSDTGFAAAGMLRISGADPTTPIITSAQTIGGSSTTSHSAPSISSGSETNTLLVTVHAYGSSYSWSTAPTGMVERIDQRSYGADNALGSTLGVFTQFSAAVWTTGTKTAVGAGGADYGLGQSILIRSVRPTVTASTGASVNEGNSDTTTLSFPISLSQAAVGAITLPYSLGGGTATGGASCTTAGVDYINTASSITIAAGATSGTINVTLCGDTTYEANETFTLTLGTPVNAVLGSPSAATGTIINDDSPPTLTISNSSLSEGNTTGASTNMNFTVTLSAASGLPTTVNYATSAGTATTGTTCVGNTDFLTTSGTLTINAGATTGTIVIPICGDTTIEADETLTLTLSSPTNATLGTPSSATGTILNDDSNIVITCVTKNPSSCSNNTSIGSRAWSNPTNAYTSNNSYASADSGNRDRQTNYLYCTGYNFAVPSGSSLLSIELGAERYASNANRFSDNSIRLIKGGVIQAFNAVNTGYYPTIDNNTSDWHSFSETGGWTVAEINAPNFGGAFSAIGRNFVYVDHLPIKVCYGTSITPLVSIAASAPIYEGNTGTINLNFNVTLNAASASSTTVQYTIGGGGGDTAVGSGTCSGTTDFIN
ncbi:MAG: Calx-beta domain-containing protein, partial [Rhodocyclaceae bacterium]|nr:Calx-beta domain-containing protein [Rhodocyclaceae bacterium]